MDIVTFFLIFFMFFFIYLCEWYYNMYNKSIFFVSNKVYDGQTTDLHCVPLISFSHSH